MAYAAALAGAYFKKRRSAVRPSVASAGAAIVTGDSASVPFSVVRSRVAAMPSGVRTR